jgi:hypothetical protein
MGNGNSLDLILEAPVNAQTRYSLKLDVLDLQFLVVFDHFLSLLNV